MKTLLNLIKKLFIISVALSLGAYAANSLRHDADSNLSIFLPIAPPSPLAVDGLIHIYDAAAESFLREAVTPADLQDLNDGEFYTFVLSLQNNTSEPMSFSNPYVTVDNNEPWQWQDFTLQSGSKLNLHIYEENMSRCMTVGSHTVNWYANDSLLLSETFHLSDQSINGQSTFWSNEFPFPSEADIKTHNSTSQIRSPYIAGWLNIGRTTRFTEYTVDFKADYLPEGTFCSLGSWTMDLSGLERTHSNVHTEYNGVHAYAGFQHTTTAQEKVSIMSFWDTYATDSQGNDVTLRAELIYPSAEQGKVFGGEGTGIQCILPYDWQEDCWYRMLLQCSRNEKTGTTLVTQWVCDLATGQWTKLCCYDTLLPDSCFKGDVAFFLENYIPKTSGDIRSMEVRNVRIKDASTGQWRNINAATIMSNGGYPAYMGSYAFGAEGDRFWAITSGVGGDWYANGSGQGQQTYKVKTADVRSPYDD